MKKSSSGVLVIDTNLLDLPTQPNLAAAILMQAAHLLTSPNLGGVMTSNYKDARAKVFHRFRALNHAPCAELPSFDQHVWKEERKKGVFVCFSEIECE